MLGRSRFGGWGGGRGSGVGIGIGSGFGVEVGVVSEIVEVEFVVESFPYSSSCFFAVVLPGSEEYKS